VASQNPEILLFLRQKMAGRNVSHNTLRPDLIWGNYNWQGSSWPNRRNLAPHGLSTIAHSSLSLNSAIRLATDEH
jgi:hypothetical protein